MARRAEVLMVLKQQKGEADEIREMRCVPVTTADVEIGDQIVIPFENYAASGTRYDGLLCTVLAWKVGEVYEDLLVIDESGVRRFAPLRIDHGKGIHWVAIPHGSVYRVAKNQKVA